MITVGLKKATKPLILTAVFLSLVPKMSSDILPRSENPHLRPQQHLSRVMALRGGHAAEHEGYRIPLEPCTEDPLGLLKEMPECKPAPRYAAKSHYVFPLFITTLYWYMYYNRDLGCMMPLKHAWHMELT
jgi:hypothetical protein